MTGGGLNRPELPAPLFTSMSGAHVPFFYSLSRATALAAEWVGGSIVRDVLCTQIRYEL